MTAGPEREDHSLAVAEAEHRTRHRFRWTSLSVPTIVEQELPEPIERQRVLTWTSNTTRQRFDGSAALPT